MATIIEEPTVGGYGKRLLSKGASEIIIDTCTHFLDAEGNEQPMNDAMKKQIDGIVIDYAGKALRTIGFAYRDLQEG